MTKSAAAIINSATALFLKHGIRRITINEICEDAEVSKMTFYRSFANKYVLAHLIIESKLESNTKIYDEIMCADISYKEKIGRILEMKRSESSEMSLELIKDIFSADDDYQDLRTLLEKAQKQFLIKLRQDFQEAKDQGHLRKDLNVDFILHMLNNMQQMMQDENLINLFSSAEELSMNLTTSFFYGILENQGEQ